MLRSARPMLLSARLAIGLVAILAVAAVVVAATPLHLATGVMIRADMAVSRGCHDAARRIGAWSTRA